MICFCFWSASAKQLSHLIDDAFWVFVLFLLLLYTSIYFLDAPQQEGNYKERHTFLQNYFSHINQDSFITLIPMNLCEGINQLESQLTEILNRGGIVIQ